MTNAASTASLGDVLCLLMFLLSAAAGRQAGGGRVCLPLPHSSPSALRILAPVIRRPPPVRCRPCTVEKSASAMRASQSTMPWGWRPAGKRGAAACRRCRALRPMDRFRPPCTQYLYLRTRPLEPHCQHPTTNSKHPTEEGAGGCRGSFACAVCLPPLRHSPLVTRHPPPLSLVPRPPPLAPRPSSLAPRPYSVVPVRLLSSGSSPATRHLPPSTVP